VSETLLDLNNGNLRYMLHIYVYIYSTPTRPHFYSAGVELCKMGGV